ncbi:MAG: GUN4 domain-containing protein [Microcoleaceae cyanobacterium]
MFKCPVCENQYLEEIPDVCQVCDWQLTPNHSSLDRIRLEWAKKVWHRLNYNSSLDNISDRLQQLEIQFQQATQERTDLQNQLEWVLYHLEVLNPEKVNSILSRFDNWIENKEESNQSWSEVGMDYNPLMEILAAKDWRAADEYTWAIILYIAGRQEQGWLQMEDINNFPCTDLRTIDYLWNYYSQGLFGLTVQQQIWESVAEEYSYFCDRVGWRNGENWKYYDELKFIQNIPSGHLPVIAWRKRACYGVGTETAATIFAAYVQRLSYCDLQ